MLPRYPASWCLHLQHRCSPPPLPPPPPIRCFHYHCLLAGEAGTGCRPPWSWWMGRGQAGKMQQTFYFPLLFTPYTLTDMRPTVYFVFRAKTTSRFLLAWRLQKTWELEGSHHRWTRTGWCWPPCRRLPGRRRSPAGRGSACCPWTAPLEQDETWEGI